MKQSIFIVFILLTFFSCKKEVQELNFGDAPSEQRTVSIAIDGNLRNFIIYLPLGYVKYINNPLIYVLHGGGGSPEGMISIANFKTIADRDKIILVYPAGIKDNWNDGRPTTPNLLGINDVSFFKQINDYLINNYAVDSTKIYATGISNGGFMTSRLGCELSNKIAAIAVVAATMESSNVETNCNPIRPLPAMYIHGTTDPLVPFDGGIMTAGAGGSILSHFQTIDKWVALNGCNTNPTITDLPDIANDGTTIKQKVYTNVTNGTEVVSYVVTDGGHTWPQGYQYLNELIIGKTSKDMNACEVIWSFFKRFEIQ